MKLKITALGFILVILLYSFTGSALAYSPFTLDVPENVTVELKYDNSGIPYFKLRFDVPITVRELNNNLLKDPEFYSDIYCEEIEIIFDVKYSTYDWNKGPSQYWNTSEYLSDFIKRGGYWEYHPFNEVPADTSEIISDNYTFRARFYTVWGENNGWVDNEVYSEYSNNASLKNDITKSSNPIPTIPPVNSNLAAKPTTNIKPTPTPIVEPTPTPSVGNNSSHSDNYDIFAKIDGILGESKHTSYINMVVVQSLRFEGYNNATPGQSSVANAQYNTIKMLKNIDIASSKLLDYMAKGIHIKTFEFIFDEIDGFTKPSLKITLKDVTISDYTVKTDSDGNLIEEIGISYTKADFEYFQISNDGKVISTYKTTIDLSSNTKASNNTIENSLADEFLVQSVIATKKYDIFAWVDGIKGESTDVYYKDQIDVLSLNFEGHSSVKSDLSKTIKTEFKTVTLVKLLDSSSANLLGAMSTGKHIKKVQFFYRKVSSASNKPVLKLTLTDIVISSYKLGVDRNGKLYEEIGISFMTAEYEYSRISSDGTVISTMKATVDLNK